MKGHHEIHGTEKHSVHLISDLLHKFSRWYELHREREMLASMSDEALKDIGLSRRGRGWSTHPHRGVHCCPPPGSAAPLISPASRRPRLY